MKTVRVLTMLWVGVALAGTAAAQREVSLASLKLERTVVLKANTHHVQGIVVDGGTLWVTSVEREARKGRLHRFTLDGSEAAGAAVEIQQGERFHPGGLDHDAVSVWIPLAEYRRESSAVIERRDKRTLRAIASWEVADHLGCVARLPQGVIAGNWDSRLLHRITVSDGAPVFTSVRRDSNPSTVRYQDMKYRDGWLIGSGVVTREQGAIEWLHPESLKVAARIACGRTDRGVVYTNEGMDVADRRLYLLPEDAPSRLFVFVLPDGWPTK
jgi:hypothetical protein